MIHVWYRAPYAIRICSFCHKVGCGYDGDMTTMAVTNVNSINTTCRLFNSKYKTNVSILLCVIIHSSLTAIQSEPFEVTIM